MGVGCCLDLAEAEYMFKLAANQANVEGQFDHAASGLRHVEWRRDLAEVHLKLSAHWGSELWVLFVRRFWYIN